MIRSVVFWGVKSTALGIAVGILLPSWLTQTMNSLLFGISPTDRVTFVVAVIVLLIVTKGATAVLALRAARVEPMQVLRQE